MEYNYIKAEKGTCLFLCWFPPREKSLGCELFIGDRGFRYRPGALSAKEFLLCVAGGGCDRYSAKSDKSGWNRGTL